MKILLFIYHVLLLRVWSPRMLKTLKKETIEIGVGVPKYEGSTSSFWKSSNVFTKTVKFSGSRK